MSATKAIFVKQLKDTYNNMGVLIQFAIFPLVALAMTVFVARGDDYMPDTMFVNMMSAAFAGMALIPTVANIVAEDKEKKSLRFLAMAGLKPASYILGVGGVMFVASMVPVVAFAFIGGLEGNTLRNFVAIMMSGVAASIMLGLSIGILAKNQQAAAGLAMPIAMLLGFGPMISDFNETVHEVMLFFYTQQFNEVNNNPDALTRPFLVMGANILVLVVFFSIVYKKKGLKG